MKSKMLLTKKQQDRIWGESGPYSEVKLSFCSRILDDSISRVFVDVEVAINPLTFEMIEKHREEFEEDEEITQLLDHSEYQGDAFGYVSLAFSAEHRGKKTIELANERLRQSEEMIIRMHKWIMRYFDSSVN